MGTKRNAGVNAFMRELDHPLKGELELVRSSILGASPEIAEEIKWNSPSFYLANSKLHFATINTYRKAKSKDCLLIVFHQGAKVKNKRAPGVAIKDPDHLLEWLGKERCTARFYELKEVKAKRAALQDVVRQWITQL